MSAGEPIAWRADGVPRSERFDDVYHSESGAPAQAKHVFLGGCGLPDAWAGRTQWRILETGFGLGLNFLTCWQAWRADPARPGLLHFVSIEAWPVARDDLLRAAAAYPELIPLAEELAAQWHGLLPGFHRLSFEDGRVLLTLCIGDVQPMLRTQQRFEADSIFLDGFSPERNPAMWSPETLKGVARFARRGTRLATWSVARALRDALGQLGFQARKLPGLPPKRDCLGAVYDPAWEPRRPPPAPEAVAQAGTCLVLGAGLAGAAVAASLARRGWLLCVLEAAHPAAGASALPVGLLAPHVSPDDALLSRLSRAGIRVTWGQLEQLLHEGQDWAASGALEQRDSSAMRLPAGWSDEGPNESWPATPERLGQAGLPEDLAALWHARAGWVRPRRLIEAWLATPGIQLLPRCRVARIAPADGGWQALDAQGALLAQADRIVIAAGHDSRAFAPALPLQPVRGQVLYGHRSAGLPPFPINGDGHLIAGVPEPRGPPMWLAGSTYDRDSDACELSEADTQANVERVARLHAKAAALLLADARGGQAQAWAGVRCASGDRRPLVGPADPHRPLGPWVCTALGSRGLSFAALCAELLAARWHGEPLPLPAALADALDTRRLL